MIWINWLLSFNVGHLKDMFVQNLMMEEKVFNAISERSVKHVPQCINLTTVTNVRNFFFKLGIHPEKIQIINTYFKISCTVCLSICKLKLYCIYEFNFQIMNSMATALRSYTQLVLCVIFILELYYIYEFNFKMKNVITA